ncbi:MAG: SDR family NAD(P)-dependent oxidoreductase [Candidatus Gracilibacteria bacterium]|nr:SDR family NAD(P)-dependent oxidoreductase [Candidatus Gracilibacteria bacterium]
MKKNILITGTSKGIGNHIVLSLKDDFNVFAISRTKISEKGVREFNIDLTNFGVFDNLVKIFEQEEVKFDGIILNAGVGFFGSFYEASDEEYLNIINLNLTSNILLLKRFEKYLNKKAKIIFIGSIIGKKFMKHSAVYQASKFALRGFAGALKNELKGIGVHIINPKIVDTTFHDNSKIPLNLETFKYTSKDEILEVVKNILSKEETRFEIDL